MTSPVLEARPQRVSLAPSPAQVMLACLRSGSEELRVLCDHPSIDWTRVSTEAHLHRVLLLVLEALQASGVLDSGSVPPESVAVMRARRRALIALALQLDHALGDVLASFATAGVPVLVLKGPTLARLYRTPLLRPRSDLDLLVDPRHWAKVDRLLVGQGYRLMDEEHVRRPLLSVLQAPEDRQYMRPGGLFIEVHADYLSTGLRRRDDAGLWRRARTVEVGGLRVPTLSPQDTFLQVTTHMERHAYTRLLWFYDLVLLLRAEGEGIPWASVARQARNAGVTTAAYFGLRYAEALFGRIAPAEAYAALRPNALQRRLHTALWPRQRILSLDVTLIRLLDAAQQAGLDKPASLPPSTFDAYAPPDRMLIHLLLSGNVAPKLWCLARRLVPREEWLRYYGPRRVSSYGLRLLLSRYLDRLVGEGEDSCSEGL